MEKESRISIRNGVIVGVILLLIPVLTDTGKRAFSWVWSSLKWSWHVLIDTYTVPGWGVLIIIILAIIGLISVSNTFTSKISSSSFPSHQDYVEDFIGSVIWRWAWNGDKLLNLAPFCPHCDAHLVYQEPSYSSFEQQVKLICENCSSIRESIEADSYQYVRDKTRREIYRRLRTDEYLKAIKEDI